MIKTWFHHLVLSRRWATFLVMGLSFFAFGAGSLNLFYLLKANTALLAEHGWQALMDGGLQQLLELLLTGYLSLLAYLVFKVCEYRLVHALADAPSAKPKSAAPAEDDGHNR
nr:hypothetical protein [uncultured Roseateles sp.]